MKSIIFKVSISVLFFVIMVVGYVFICTDAEYNMNQQIARGFISKDAQFFHIVDPSKPTARWGWLETDPETGNQYVKGNVIIDVSPDGIISSDYTPIEASDPDFILENVVLPDGYTSVEAMLSSGKEDYFAALHRDTLRAVYYHGSASDLVPLVNGRFFTSEECLSDEPLAVIGQNVSESENVVQENDTSYLNFLGRKYRVIGICGLTGKSAMDSLVFVNLGSLSPEEQLNGIFYIDNADNKEQTVFEEMNAKSEELLHTTLEKRKTPSALIDMISGGMYLKDYLKISMLFLMLLFCGSIVIQIIRRQTQKVSVFRLCGISFPRVVFHSCRELIIWGIGGTLCGLLTIGIFFFYKIFSLSMAYMNSVVWILSGISIGVLAIMVLIVAVAEYFIDFGKVVARI